MLGGKLPGLVGGHQDGHPDSTVTGGVHPTGRNGWSARIMWRKDGQIVQYVYHMNTPGKKNGRIRSWLYDIQALDIQNLEFRSTKDLRIDAFYLSTFFGGDELDWAATKNESIRFDGFQVFE